MRQRAPGAAGVLAIAASGAAVALAVALGALACSEPPRTAIIGGAVPAPAVRDPYSNVRASDYVGPDACADCHEDKHARWRKSLHAAMNARVDAAGAAGAAGAVIGDFGGARLAYAGGAATFARDGAAFVMDLAPAGGPHRRFRVTRTIGARALQEYVGVEVDGPEPAGDPIYATELRLPFGWWPRAGGWMPRQYYDSWYGDEYGPDGRVAVDPYAPDREPWAGRCAWCHNTYPFEIRLVRAAARDVGHGMEQWLALAKDDRPAASRRAIGEQNLLPTDELVTVGISCESCHLGGKRHATRGREVPPRFVPSSPDLLVRAGAPDLRGGRKNPVVVDAICAQCHSTPSPRYPNGAAVRNSTEALDLLAGACAPSIKCTDCHDPHTAGPGPGAPDAPRALEACTRCHARLAAPAAAAAHARHPAGAATCLDCHMPRIVAGVAAFVRTHRVSSPADPVMLAAGAPNACNLCHLDRSIAWTVRALADGWGVRLAPDAAWRATYGDLERPLGPWWLGAADGAVRITAAAAYARSPLGRAALPDLVTLLGDPVAYDRVWSQFAVEDVVGRRLRRDEYDPLAPPAARAAQVEALRAALTSAR